MNVQANKIAPVAAHDAAASLPGYLECRSDSMDSTEVGSFLTFHVNLDERGEYYADVRNAYDKTVFEIFGSEIIEDGFMQSKSDLEGLKAYLVQLGIMTLDQMLVEG